MNQLHSPPLFEFERGSLDRSWLLSTARTEPAVSLPPLALLELVPEVAGRRQVELVPEVTGRRQLAGRWLVVGRREVADSWEAALLVLVHSHSVVMAAWTYS